MVTFSCFRMATFRPATQKCATFHALRFRLLFVVPLPGEAKGRNAKPRQNHHLAGFRLATFRVFAPKTRLYDMAQISHHTIPLLTWCQCSWRTCRCLGSPRTSVARALVPSPPPRSGGHPARCTRKQTEVIRFYYYYLIYLFSLKRNFFIRIITA